jgi:hypothetical protein
MKVGFMHSIWVGASISAGHADDSMPPPGLPATVARPSGIVPLQLKWGVGVADLHRE